MLRRTSPTKTRPSDLGLTATLRKCAKSPVTVAGVGIAVAGVAVASAAPAHAATTASTATARTATSSAAPTKAASAKAVSARTDPASHGTAAATRAAGAAHSHRAASEHAKRHRTPMALRLMPVGTSGSQAWMPISPAQLANARTIVHQALAKGMGARSAVIAVATAMQESQLVNVDYGTSDSLGLFQQQPDCGWGTAQQVLNPTYAADAFLTALRSHQAADPGWAAQPLWANAQAVQKSAFPFAYAKWETQAAHLVRQVAR